MIEWIQNNWIEIIGATFAFLYLILEIKQNWIMWIVGIVSSTFYIYIFFHNCLYAEAGLNGYYVALSFYGLYHWKFARKNKNSKVCRISSSLGLRTTIIGIIVLIVLTGILIRYTDSPVPVPDALVATLGIIATWMTAKKIIECWYLWIFANFFAMGLYIYQQLYPTTILYAIYGMFSIIGLIEWRKSLL